MPASHAQALAEVHVKPGTLHLFPVEAIERLRLSHFEHVTPAPGSPLSQVVDFLLRVGLGAAFHRGDRGRGNRLFAGGGGGEEQNKTCQENSHKVRKQHGGSGGWRVAKGGRALVKRQTRPPITMQ